MCAKFEELGWVTVPFNSIFETPTSFFPMRGCFRRICMCVGWVLMNFVVLVTIYGWLFHRQKGTLIQIQMTNGDYRVKCFFQTKFIRFWTEIWTCDPTSVTTTEARLLTSICKWRFDKHSERVLGVRIDALFMERLNLTVIRRYSEWPFPMAIR